MCPIHWAACWRHREIVKILAPLTANPNAPNNNGYTPIGAAVLFGHTEIVKILAPLTDNPNAPNKDGDTPIHLATLLGKSAKASRNLKKRCAEIVKFLAPLTDDSIQILRHRGTDGELGHVPHLGFLKVLNQKPPFFPPKKVKPATRFFLSKK